MVAGGAPATGQCSNTPRLGPSKPLACTLSLLPLLAFTTQAGAATAPLAASTISSSGGLEYVYVHWILPLAWLLLAAAGAILLCQRIRRVTRREIGALAALIALALVIRLCLSPMGPGDIKNTLLSAYEGWPGAGLSEVERYGRGVEGLLVWLFLLVPANDAAVVGASLAAGVASVPLLASLALRLGFSRRAALTAAVLLAVCPLHIRFSPTTGRYALLIFLLLAGWTQLLAWLQEGRRISLVVAVLALTIAAQCRPEALATPLVTAGLLLSQTRRVPVGFRRRLPTLGFASAIHIVLLIVPALPLLLLALNQTELAAYLPRPRPLFSAAHNPFFSPDFTPYVWMTAAVFGLFVGPRGSVAWCALGALFLSFLLCSTIISDVHLLNARYHLTAMPLYLLLAGNGLDAAARVTRIDRLRYPWSAVATSALVVGLAATAVAPLPAVLRTTTPDHEYRFLQEALHEVPNGCDIYYPDTGWDHGLRAQPGLSTSAGRRHRWLPLERWDPTSQQRCAVFFRSSACSAVGDPRYRPLRERCRTLADASTGEIETRAVPNIPMRGEEYASNPVQIGIFWIQRP